MGGKKEKDPNKPPKEKPPPAKTPLGKIRHLVSKKKRRFIEGGFDLDLTYATQRLIACGFPATGAEACYRNPASEMKSFIQKYHADHMMVYNLCMESDRVYSLSILGLSTERVERFQGCQVGIPREREIAAL